MWSKPNLCSLICNNEYHVGGGLNLQTPLPLIFNMITFNLKRPGISLTQDQDLQMLWQASTERGLNLILFPSLYQLFSLWKKVNLCCWTVRCPPTLLPSCGLIWPSLRPMGLPCHGESPPSSPVVQLAVFRPASGYWWETGAWPPLSRDWAPSDPQAVGGGSPFGSACWRWLWLFG